MHQIREHPHKGFKIYDTLTLVEAMSYIKVMFICKKHILSIKHLKLDYTYGKLIQRNRTQYIKSVNLMQTIITSQKDYPMCIEEDVHSIRLENQH